MADLGTIGKLVDSDIISDGYRIPIAFYTYSSDVMKPHTASNWGKISGTVYYSTTPVQYGKLLLIYEPIMVVVATTMTDDTGYFEFNDIHIGGSARTYSVVAFRDTQNARVFSGIQAYDPYL